MSERFSAAIVLAVVLALSVWTQPGRAAAPKCLFVSSYHQGLQWSDGIERALRATLAGRCEIRQFDMDTKRRRSEAEKRASALAAKALIEEWRPDVVIAADDNAAKYLIQPYFRDADLPFVFCGVNWTADAYGFPYRNVTGMIEVAPIEPMLEAATDLVPGLARAVYLGADTLSAAKNAQRLHMAAADRGIALDARLVGNAADWLEAFRAAQAYDVVILGAVGGVADWDDRAMARAVMAASRRPSVTMVEWMAPYAMVGVTKVAAEQGEWAGRVALEVLAGTAPSRIPIVINRRRDVWVNVALADRAGVALPAALTRKAKRFGSDKPKS